MALSMEGAHDLEQSSCARLTQGNEPAGFSILEDSPGGAGTGMLSALFRLLLRVSGVTCTDLICAVPLVPIPNVMLSIKKSHADTFDLTVTRRIP